MGDLDYLFGPINKKYCIFFYILSVVGFVYFLGFLITGVYLGVVKRKPTEYFFMIASGALMFFFFYFQNRLLYTMCSQSL